MTKRQATRHFRQFILPEVVAHYEQGGRPDESARAEAWNNWTDALCKEGAITQHQYDTWTMSNFSALTIRHPR